MQLEPPKIPAEDFAKNFPDGKDVQRASNLELDDLIDPANPGQLPDVEDLTRTQALPELQPSWTSRPMPRGGDGAVRLGAPASTAPRSASADGDPQPASRAGTQRVRERASHPRQLPEAEAASANADQLDRLRRDADAAYERSQQLAQDVRAEPRDRCREGNELLKVPTPRRRRKLWKSRSIRRAAPA